LAALVLLAASVNAAAAQTGADARLLVLLRDASALAVVDPASGTVLGQVPTVSGPHEVTATPDGKLAFVASPSDGISVIDLETLTELRRLDIGAGSEPHDVRFADGKLYFTVEGFKAIGRYDPQADEVDWLLGLGQDGTHMMVLSRDRDTIFTANRESDTVSIIEDAADGPPDWQVTSIPADGAYPEGLDLSPDGAELWVATRNDGDVSIIDVASKTVSERLDLNFEDPNRLAFTPDGARVLVSDSATSVVVMDAAARTEITRFDLAPNALLVRPDGAVAYAALRGDDRVAIIDLETLEVTGEIPTGADSGPGCMFWLAGQG
jgi:YVTN family beta-propeller protein